MKISISLLVLLTALLSSSWASAEPSPYSVIDKKFDKARDITVFQLPQITDLAAWKCTTFIYTDTSQSEIKIGAGIPVYVRGIEITPAVAPIAAIGPFPAKPGIPSRRIYRDLVVHVTSATDSILKMSPTELYQEAKAMNGPVLQLVDTLTASRRLSVTAGWDGRFRQSGFYRLTAKNELIYFGYIGRGVSYYRYCWHGSSSFYQSERAL